MKLHGIGSKVEVNGDNSTSSFSIALNGKAFRVLSDTLYKNKIASIVREISCNAYDAHIMAGKKDVPFEIHLPDAFEPWFSVKDYGVGLNEEEIKNVFTVYFKSSKEDTNDAVGAFGLGAKTPFSYTDQFTVTSVKDGKKTIYSAYITESGIPGISEMHSEYTTDPNGVEIRMSVKREDYHTFLMETQNQLKYFVVKPIIQNKQVQWPEYKYVTELNSGKILEGNGYGYNHFTVIQGNVGYPLENEFINHREADKDAVTFLKSLSGVPLHLFFNIGEIGVTASREGIEYNSHTVQNINKKLLALKQEFADYVSEQVKTLKNTFEKFEFLNRSPLLRRFGEPKEFKAKIRMVSGEYKYDVETLLQEEYEFDDINGNKKKGTRRAYGIRRWNMYNPNAAWGNPCLAPHNKMQIIIRNNSNRCKMKIEHFIEENKGKFSEIIEIVPENADRINKDLKQNLIDFFDGFANVMEIDDIKLPVDSTGKVKVKKKYDSPTSWVPNTHFNHDTTTWKECFDDFEDICDEHDKVVYIPVYRKGCTYDRMMMLAKVDTFVKYTKQKVHYVAVREGEVDKIKKYKNAYLVDNFLEELKKILAKDKSSYFIKCKNQLIRKHVRSALSNFVNTSFNNMVKTLRQYSSEHPYVRIADFVAKLHKKEHDTRLEEVCRFIDDKAFDVMITSAALRGTAVVDNIRSKFKDDDVFKTFIDQGNLYRLTEAQLRVMAELIFTKELVKVQNEILEQEKQQTKNSALDFRLAA